MQLTKRKTANPKAVDEALEAGYRLTWQAGRDLGITRRQLQWWDEQGYVKPAQILHRRLYSPEQLEQLRKMAKLRKAGVSLQQIRRLGLLKLSFTSVVKVRKPVMMGDVLLVRAVSE